MNHPDRFSAQQLNRLHDQAHAQAETLRREAMASFWSAIWRWLTEAGRSLAGVRAARESAPPKTLSCAH